MNGEQISQQLKSRWLSLLGEKINVLNMRKLHGGLVMVGSINWTRTNQNKTAFSQCVTIEKTIAMPVAKTATLDKSHSFDQSDLIPD